jgi:hypothetical protein
LFERRWEVKCGLLRELLNRCGEEARDYVVAVVFLAFSFLPEDFDLDWG